MTANGASALPRNLLEMQPCTGPRPETDGGSPQRALSPCDQTAKRNNFEEGRLLLIRWF